MWPISSISLHYTDWVCGAKLISNKMPPFSTDDYYKLLQKIAVLETKILRLEVNMEVNGQYGNETTLPMTQISGKGAG